MTGNSLLRRDKMVKCGGEFNRSDFNRTLETPSSPVHLVSPDENACSGTRQASQHSINTSSQQDAQSTDGIWLIDEEGTPIRRRGPTTCADIQGLPSGTRIQIEVNDDGIPCNIPESTLLGSFLGVIARDAMLAPINFSDWRNKGMELFKKKMLAEVETKFDILGHIRSWILQSIGVKWRNYKTNLKSEYFDSRPIEEIMEAVPEGVDPSQWCQLVTQWTQPRDQERAAKNTASAKKQTCPHTMGRISSIRRKCEREGHE